MLEVTDDRRPEDVIKSTSPWTRKRKTTEYRGCFEIPIHSFRDSFADVSEANNDLDIQSKRAALKVSASVVSVVSHKDGKKALFMGSGTIIECEKNASDSYISTILTAASPFGVSTKGPIKVDVILPDEKICHAQDFSFNYDFHYNVATLKIHTDSPLPAATLRRVDDCIGVNPYEIHCPGGRGEGSHSVQLCPHSDSFPLCPGGILLVVGRHFSKPNELMAAPGQFSLDSCNFDCKELLRVNCAISKCGIGGPTINLYGEVIGVNFYDRLCTPFLPINLALKCFEHFTKHGRFLRPWLGLEATNLYAASIEKLEKMIQKFPNISKGVIVEEVVSGSSSDRAGIQCGDIIVQCGGLVVHSFLELLERIWNKSGEALEIVVIRDGASMHITMDVLETPKDKFYSWPVPEQRRIFVERVRW